MERNQGLVVLLLVALVLLSVVVAWYLANRQDGPGGLGPTARFTAKAGTTRENAVALSTSKRPAADPAARNAPPGGEGVRVRSLTPEAPRVAADESRVTPAVREALNAWRPDLGLEKLEGMLDDDTLAPAERAEILAAMGVLAGQLDTPDFERAARCFSQALQLDLPPAQRARIAFEDAQMLLRQGRSDEAHARLKAERDRQPAGVRALQLDLLYATLEEQRGNSDDAEKIYAGALEQAMASGDGVDAQTEDMLRMAALRLSRIYRDAGRGSDASTLSRRFGEAFAAAP